GSPEATRRAFNKRFLLDLAEDWQQHGREVFKRVRRESPAAYLKVCAMLVPKEMQIEHKGGIKAMTDEQIEAAIEMIQGMLAAREAGADAKVIIVVKGGAAAWSASRSQCRMEAPERARSMAARSARPTSFLSCHRTSMWAPRWGGLFGFKFSSRRHPRKFGQKRFLAVRRSWRGNGVACFWATSLGKIFGGVIAIISFRSGGWMQQSAVPRCAILSVRSMGVEASGSETRSVVRRRGRSRPPRGTKKPLRITRKSFNR